MAAVPPLPMVDMGFTFNEPKPQDDDDDDDNPRKKRTKLRIKMPSLRHPTVALFNQRIKVGPAQERFPASAADHSMPTPRWDGAADLACWTVPQTKAIEDIPLMIRRRGLNKIKVAAVGVVGPGEVALISGSGTEKSVLVYHGGGLYTRYMELAEVNVKKGDRVRAGARIGAMPMALAGRKPASVTWKAWLGKTPVNPQSLLEQSSRLCGSK
jgi:murein DD-endopeptidase MepM/ murein hydrolase activator NlpD